MPHVAFATGHANGRQLDTTAGALKTRLETWDANIKFSLRTPSFSTKLRLIFSSLPFTCSSIEAGLLKVGEQSGTCTKRCVALRPSQWLIEKRGEKINYRKSTTDPGAQSSACTGESCRLGSPNKYPNMYRIPAYGKNYAAVRF